MITDPNLRKICDTNMYLIKRGRPSRAIVQGKDYLINILGEHQITKVDRELDEFADHCRQLVTNYKERERNNA